jgi:hypothetical protein
MPNEISVALISSGRSGFNWGFPLFNNHTLKPIAPKITTTVVALIVIPYKAHLFMDVPIALLEFLFKNISVRSQLPYFLDLPRYDKL